MSQRITFTLTEEEKQLLADTMPPSWDEEDKQDFKDTMSQFKDVMKEFRKRVADRKKNK